MKDKLAERKPTEFVRSANNYDPDAWSTATGTDNKDPSLTQQQFAEESDINYIADRFGLTGELPTVLAQPTFGDFTGIFDFQTAQNAVVQAKQQFMQLPAKLRTRFNNDPQQLLEFLDDESNRAEAEIIGLVKKKDNLADDKGQLPLGEPAGEGKGGAPSAPPKPAGEPSKHAKTAKTQDT